MSPRRTSVTASVGLVVLGLVLGVVGAVVSSARLQVGSVTVPWGVVLMVAALVACIRAAAWSEGSRGAGALVALGWCVATLTVLFVNPGNDVLLPDVGRTQAYLALGTILAIVSALWRVRREPVPEPYADGLAVTVLPDTLPPASGEADGVR